LDRDDRGTPAGWENVTEPSKLKEKLANFGIPEEDYYTILGLEMKNQTITKKEKRNSKAAKANGKVKGRKK